jgi:hypothetical protein
MVRWRRSGSACALACFLAGCGNFAATWNSLRGDAYPLDEVSREPSDAGDAHCPVDVEYVDYAGDLVRYQRPVQIAAAFAPKLRAFEAAVVEVAREHYGRPPDRLVHYGAKVCRRVRGSSSRLSEHALGNALDLSGFEWQRAAGTKSGNDIPRSAFERPFSVSILRHWSTTEPEEQIHRAFLRALADRLIDRDLFRGVIGPGREGHANHLHLDYAPWTYTLF